MALTTLQRNVVANFAAKGWGAAVSFAVVPVYLYLLGPSAYGLVGVYASLAGIVSLLDLGLSSTLNRELARSVGEPRLVRDTVRTFELAYWAIGILTGAVVAVAAPGIVLWFESAELPRETTVHAIRCMGVVLAAQWPASLYLGGLAGLERQVLAGALTAVGATVQAVATIAVLHGVAPSIDAFFLAQAGGSAVFSIACGWYLWKALPGPLEPARLRLDVLAGHVRFAAGVTGVALTTVLLTQIDKLVLSRVVALETLGYYTIAWKAATAVPMLVSPIAAAIFPRFARLIADTQPDELSRTYHTACQLVAAVTIGPALFLALFSGEVLAVWTRSEVVATQASGPLTFLALGYGMNSQVAIPYSLQVAGGWTRLTLTTNVIAVAILAVVLPPLTRRNGLEGAAAAWTALNVGYLVIWAPLTHKRVLPGELWRWYRNAIVVPVVSTGLLLLLARAATIGAGATAATVAGLGATALAVPLSALATADSRGALVRFLRNTPVRA